jgi:DNA-binding LacI/PurR family transcriptional regulator
VGARPKSKTRARSRSRPLTDGLVGRLRQAISEGRFADGRLPDERALTAEFGVSRGTVRAALEVLESEGLILRVQGRGTLLREGAVLPAAATGRIGVICRQLPPREEEASSAPAGFYGELLRGITAAATSSGRDLVVYGPGAFARLAEIAGSGVSGLLLLGTSDPIALLRVADAGLPAVLVDHSTDVVDIDSVDIDSTGGAVAAVRHLCALGHREIGYVDWNRRKLSRPRFEGYRRGLEICGLRYRASRVAAAGAHEQGGAAALRRLLKVRPRPTAVFAFSDTMARGAVRAALADGVRIPEDLSLVGFGDLPLATSEPPHLTTMRIDCTGMGETAFRRLAERVRRPGMKTAQFLMSAALVERDTTARRVRGER